MKHEIVAKRKFALDLEGRQQLAHYISRLIIFKRTFKVNFCETYFMLWVDEAKENKTVDEKRKLIFKNSDLDKRRIYFWRATAEKTYTYFWEYDKGTNWNFYAHVEGHLPTLTPDEYFVFPDRAPESESIFEEELWKVLRFRKLLQAKQEKKG